VSNLSKSGLFICQNLGGHCILHPNGLKMHPSEGGEMSKTSRLGFIKQSLF